MAGIVPYSHAASPAPPPFPPLLAHLQAGWTDAASYSDKHGGIGLLVWSKGRVVYENYRRDAGANYPENIYSITKTLSALATLAAVGQGKLQLDQPIDLPEWKGSPSRKRITLRELLDQTSGLDPGYDVLYGKSLSDKRARVLDLPSLTPPGTNFRYGPEHYELIEALVARRITPATGDWLQGSVLTPLAISGGDWRHDRLGHPFFSAGAFLTARDLLKVGHLIRRHGRVWIFPLIPASLIDQATHGSAANPMYGFGLWLNRNSHQEGVVERDVEEAIGASLSRDQWSHSALSRIAPPDLIAMVGSYGQRVYIVPSEDLVVVRLGRSPGFRDPDFLRELYRR